MELKIAQIQMPVTADRAENIRRACDMVRQAGDIDMAVLPEMFCCPYDNACFRPYGGEEGGPAWQALSALAKERGIWLVGGTMPELAAGRVYNTCYVFAPDGQMAAKHRKVHLFDIDVTGGQRFMESETLTAGDSVTTFDTPWGTVGVCVCFDFRFTELSELMVLAGAKLIVVPAAFNMTTGPAHWELLFRQRAVDGQCYTWAPPRPGIPRRAMWPGATPSCATRGGQLSISVTKRRRWPSPPWIWSGWRPSGGNCPFSLPDARMYMSCGEDDFAIEFIDNQMEEK